MTRYLLAALFATAAIDAGAGPEAPNGGPQLPARLRTPQAPPHPGASGEALRSEAMQKLRRSFEEADRDASGALTREEASGAGLGFIAANFEQIDSAGSGKVSFDDVRRYLQQRRK